MENVNNVSVNAPFNMEELLKKQYENLIEDPLILKYISEHNMTLEDVKENVPLFNHMLADLKKCSNCKGIENCAQTAKGQLSVLFKNEKIDWYISDCKYKKAYNEAKKVQSLYKYGRFNEEMMNLSLSEIKIFEDNKSYMNAYCEIVEYCKNHEGKGIYLYGSCGVGKTYLMIALCNFFVLNNKTIAFVNVPDLCIKMKDNYNRDDIQTIINADFVVFDDIGQETVNSFTRDELLFNLLNERMQSKKPTCFTSNFNFEELGNHFKVNQYKDIEEMKALRLMERIRALSKEVGIIGKSLR